MLNYNQKQWHFCASVEWGLQIELKYPKILTTPVSIFGFSASLYISWLKHIFQFTITNPLHSTSRVECIVVHRISNFIGIF